MAFVQIPKSNTLRMVRTDNQSSNIANFDNRLLHQEDYFGYNDVPYAQKISSSDNILIQYSTDYTTVTAKVYNLDDELVIDKTTSITELLESTTFTIYDLLFTLGTAGYYYLIIDFDASTEIYQSEIFQIDGYETDRFIKIEYNTSDNDGITYSNSETFVIRLEGRMVEYTPGQNKTVYTNFDESLDNLNSFAKFGAKIEYGAIPRYMLEKLNIALGHEVFKVNDVEYQSEGEAEGEIVKSDQIVTNMYKGETNLQKVDYENYELATDEAPVETYHIEIDESGGKTIMVEDGVNYFNRYKD